MDDESHPFGCIVTIHNVLRADCGLLLACLGWQTDWVWRWICILDPTCPTRLRSFEPAPVEGQPKPILTLSLGETHLNLSWIVGGGVGGGVLVQRWVL